MSLRDKLNKGGTGIAFAAICLVAAALFVYMLRPKTGFEGVGERIWIYNMDTGALTRMPKSTTYPPVELDDGTGYEATVFRCTSDGEDEQKVAFLTRYTDDALKALQAQDGEINESNLWVLLNPGRSRVVASVEGAKQGKWGPATLGRTDTLLKEAVASCGGAFEMSVP